MVWFCGVDRCSELVLPRQSCKFCCITRFEAECDCMIISVSFICSLCLMLSALFWLFDFCSAFKWNTISLLLSSILDRKASIVASVKELWKLSSFSTKAMMSSCRHRVLIPSFTLCRKFLVVRELENVDKSTAISFLARSQASARSTRRYNHRVSECSKLPWSPNLILLSERSCVAANLKTGFDDPCVLRGT